MKTIQSVQATECNRKQNMNISFNYV